MPTPYPQTPPTNPPMKTLGGITFELGDIAQFKPSVTTTAYAASITPAVANFGALTVINVGVLTGNITINAPTGTPVDGQEIEFRFQQDSSGNRSLTFNSVFEFTNFINPPTGSETQPPNSFFTLRFEYVASRNKFRAVRVS